MLAAVGPELWIPVISLGATSIVTAIIAPLVMMNRTAILAIKSKEFDAAQRAIEKAAEKAERDEVALRAEAAVKAVEEATAATVEQQAKTEIKLDEIKATGAITHTLVNSNYTASKEAQLAQAKISLVLAKKIIALGSNPALPEDIAVVESTELSIEALEKELADRRKQQDVVDAQTIALTKESAK